MIVSQFELLVKRIAPTTGLPAFAAAPFRRIVQGYFLNITNLERRTINLRLKVTIPIPGTPIADRELVLSPTPNFAMTFDNAPTNNQPLTLSLLSSTSTSKTFITPALFGRSSGAIQIGPLQTASVKLLPSTAPTVLESANLEIRGFIELVQTRANSSFGFALGAVRPADILITPEIRGTVLDNAYPTMNASDELDFDQVSYSLPTASGKVQNVVEGISAFAIEAVSADVRTLMSKPMIELSQDDSLMIEEEMSRLEE